MGWRFRKSIRLAKGVRLSMESGKKRGQPDRINGMREARFSRQVVGNVDICCCHHSRLCENFVSQQVKILYFISSIQALRRGTVSLRMLSRWVLPDTKERYKREWKCIWTPQLSILSCGFRILPVAFPSSRSLRVTVLSILLSGTRFWRHPSHYPSPHAFFRIRCLVGEVELCRRNLPIVHVHRTPFL